MASLLVALGASACTTVRLTDDVDLTFDFSPLIGPSNLLHQPYVQGSEMNVYVDHSDNDKDLSGWSLRSADPAIFSIDETVFQRFDDNYFRVHCHANQAGVAVLEVVDNNGRVKHKTTVEVRKPDRVDFLAHGPLLVDRPDLDPLTPSPQVLGGGTATFLVRYYEGNQQLNGNRALHVDSTADVTVSTPQSFLFEDRDWLQVTPHAAGDFSLPVKVGADMVANFSVHGVPDSAIAEIRILGEDESRAKRGEWLVALAQAYDAAQKPIFGVEYDWELDGAAELGEGDLYRYEYDPKLKRNIEAHFGAHDAVAVIHGEDGFVDSSNNIGCNTTSLPASLISLCAVAFALCVSRRRRA